jgi:DNA-directed RNA polymerase subunit RPC12/RpoP
MTFPCTCQACGSVNHVEWSQAGQTISCGGCSAKLDVPAPMETDGAADGQNSLMKFRCPACGRKFATKAELAGKKIRCSGCGAGVRVPVPGGNVVAPLSRSDHRTRERNAGAAHKSQSSQRQESPARAADSTADEEEFSQASPLLEELGALEETTTRRRAATVLSSRSEMLEQARLKGAESGDVEASSSTSTSAPTATDERPKKKKTKKGKKKKKGGYFDAKETLKLVAGVGGFVALLTFLAWGYPGMRFPLGGLLCVVGFIVYLLGASALRQLVAEDSPLKALMCRFFPPYQWWYVATHWAETKDFVAFFGAGTLILSIGGLIIKTSEQGKRAEASDRKFQEAQRARQAELLPAPLDRNAAPPPTAKVVEVAD